LSKIAREHLPPSAAARLATVDKKLHRVVGDPLPPLAKAIPDLLQLPVNGGIEQVKELMKLFAVMLDRADDPQALGAVTTELYAVFDKCTSPAKAGLLTLFAERIDRWPAEEQGAVFDGLLRDALVGICVADLLKPLQALARQLKACPPEQQFPALCELIHQTRYPAHALSSPEQSQLLVTLAGETGALADSSRACRLLSERASAMPRTHGLPVLQALKAQGVSRTP
jgi:hypothetical protein